MYNDFHVSSTNQKPTNQKPKNGSNERVKLWLKNPLWSPILILNLFYGLLIFKVMVKFDQVNMDVVKMDVVNMDVVKMDVKD